MYTCIFVSTDVFCPEVAKQRWDRVKIICRQPYKKLTQFGLSFIRIRSNDTTDQEKRQSTDVKLTAVADFQSHFLGRLDNRYKTLHLCLSLNITKDSFPCNVMIVVLHLS